MGDRANIHASPGIYFYTHWDGYKLPLVLQAALRRGKQRWDDESYLNRIIFCEMVRGYELELTGYGISASICDNEHELIEVDHGNGTVGIGDKLWTFAEYVAAPEEEIMEAYGETTLS